MNDPHVVALFYDIEHGDSVNYKKTKPIGSRPNNAVLQQRETYISLIGLSKHIPVSKSLDVHGTYFQRNMDLSSQVS